MTDALSDECTGSQTTITTITGGGGGGGGGTTGIASPAVLRWAIDHTIRPTKRRRLLHPSLSTVLSLCINIEVLPRLYSSRGGETRPFTLSRSRLSSRRGAKPHNNRAVDGSWRTHYIINTVSMIISRHLSAIKYSMPFGRQACLQ